MKLRSTPASSKRQVEILKSENIALKVIKDLHLEDDPEFADGGFNPIRAILGLIFDSGESSQTENARVRQAVRIFQTRLGVRRVGLTYVMEVSFRSFDRDRAAEIANAIANAYVVDQLEAKYLAARRAGTWLQDRLKELRGQAGDAERAVVDYKTKNDIVDTGGRLMNEQQLAELNSQMTVAKASVTEARAKLDRIRSVLNSNSIADGVVATVTDTLKNDVITKLRSKYLDLSAQEADISRRYGVNHQAAVNLRNQMKEIENSIRNELQRIAKSFKSEYEISTQRQEGLQKQLDEVVSQSQVKNEAQVKLRELESNSQSYRALYDNFLQRYVESVQQQSFPITEARIISAASRPLSKSHPKTTLTLIFAAFGGILIGIGIGAWRSVFDNVLRSVGRGRTPVADRTASRSCRAWRAFSRMPATSREDGAGKVTGSRAQAIPERSCPVFAKPVIRDCRCAVLRDRRERPRNQGCDRSARRQWAGRPDHRRDLVDTA